MALITTPLDCSSASSALSSANSGICGDELAWSAVAAAVRVAHGVPEVALDGRALRSRSSSRCPLLPASRNVGLYGIRTRVCGTEPWTDPSITRVTTITTKTTVTNQGPRSPGRFGGGPCPPSDLCAPRLLGSRCLPPPPPSGGRPELSDPRGGVNMCRQPRFASCRQLTGIFRGLVRNPTPLAGRKLRIPGRDVDRSLPAHSSIPPQSAHAVPSKAHLDRWPARAAWGDRRSPPRSASPLPRGAGDDRGRDRGPRRRRPERSAGRAGEGLAEVELHPGLHHVTISRRACARGVPARPGSGAAARGDARPQPGLRAVRRCRTGDERPADDRQGVGARAATAPASRARTLRPAHPGRAGERSAGRPPGRAADFSSIARIGPVARQADTIRAHAAIPARSGVIAVATPEQMAVSEALELRAVAGRSVRPRDRRRRRQPRCSRPASAPWTGVRSPAPR